MNTTKIYVVLTGEEPKNFINSDNAEIYADATPGAELQEEFFELNPEELQRLIDQKQIYDYIPGQEPETEQSNQPEAPQEQEKPSTKKITKAQLLEMLEKLEAENKQLKEQPKKPQKIDFAKAAEVYKRKGELLQSIQGFTGVLTMIDTVSFDTDNESPFDATNAAVVFRAGSSSYNIKDILSITNIDIVKEVQSLIIKKLNERIAEIQTEVESLDFI